MSKKKALEEFRRNQAKIRRDQFIQQAIHARKYSAARTLQMQLDLIDLILDLRKSANNE
jgi:hypothetical protein